MNNQYKEIEDIKKIFKNLELSDPKIKFSDCLIELIPYYWNYAFITNFMPLFGVAFIIFLFQQEIIIEKYFLWAFAVIVSLWGIFTQLPYYNKISIDYSNKIIKIKPNIIMSFFTKETIIIFKFIKSIDYISDGFWLSYRRYVIRIILANSDEFKLISTPKEENAKKIKETLLSLL